MLVALVKNDKVKLLGKEGTHRVSSYTSLKTQPAVYLKEPLDDGQRSAFLSDVIEVNGVKVEYDEAAHLLNALGPLKRTYQLPQPGDKVTYTLVETDFKEEKVTSKVQDLRLHARGNASKSLQVKVEGGTMLELTDIVDIERKVGGERFDRAGFQRYYVDYLSFGKQDEA
jgi:hypothetical protein